jgi:hypothetical protein
MVLLIASASLIVIASSCATKTRVSSQWLSAEYSGEPMHKILVVGISETSLGRKIWEKQFSDALVSHGAEAVPSYKTLPTDDMLTRQELVEALQAGGFQGVIVTRLLEVKEDTTYVPPSSHVVPSYGHGYYGYYGRSYDVVNTPGYTRSTEIVRVETRLWNAENSKLAWGIISETFDPKSNDDAIESVTKKLVEKLAADGLIAR